MEGLGIDWAALWNAGGVWAVLAVAVAIALIIYVARWDKSRPVDNQDAAIERLSDKLDALILGTERRLTIAETRLDDHQRQLDRLDRREK